MPVLFADGIGSALLIGTSMVPRAEVAMIVMHQARALAPAPVPPPVYAAMVLVAAATSVAAPLMLKPMLRRWRQRPEPGAWRRGGTSA